METGNERETGIERETEGSETEEMTEGLPNRDHSREKEH